MGEGNGTAADAADMGDERVAVRDGNERRERSGEDHFAGTEGHAEAAKRVRKPCHRIQRRALDGGADAGRYRFAILLDEQARSEEHTSELQSLMRISYAVFCLKKKNNLQHKQ